jgi:hypothetical protein
MDEPNWIDQEIARVAETQAAGDDHPEPHAQSARFDRKSRRVLVELDNGCLFAFPAKNVQGLELATLEELSDIELLGGGYALHWPRVNADIRIESALVGVFGSRKWMARLAAREAGSRTSERKAASARANGAKGGRPPGSRKVAA